MLSTTKNSTSVKWRIIAIVYFFFLVAATHTPQKRMPESLDLFGLDKILHVVAYAILTVLFMRAAGTGRPLLYRVVSVVVILGIAGIDEYTQTYVGRTCSVHDWLADIAGISLALFCLMCLKGRKCQRSVAPNL